MAHAPEVPIIAVASLPRVFLNFIHLHVSYHKGTMGFDKAPQHGRPGTPLAEAASALRRGGTLSPAVKQQSLHTCLPLLGVWVRAGS